MTVIDHRPIVFSWQLEVTREEEMVAEAATVEAVWVVEPPLLENLLLAEMSAFCAEQVHFYDVGGDEWQMQYTSDAVYLCSEQNLNT